MQSAAYARVGATPAPTGAGLIDGADWVKTTSNEAVNVVRSAMMRAVSLFFFATAVFSGLAFLSTANVSNKFVCSMSTVICLIGTVNYFSIAQIRGQSMRLWNRMDPSSTYESNIARAQIQELAVDAIRHAGWIVTVPFILFKLYHLIGRVKTEENNIFLSVDVAIVVAIIGLLASAYIRLGLDEMWSNVDGTLWATGIVAGLVAAAMITLLLIDLSSAARGIPDNGLLISYFWTWIGYPVTYLLSAWARNSQAATAVEAQKEKEVGAYPFYLSVTKDIVFMLLDLWNGALFAIWTANSAFGKTVLNTSPATPYYSS